MYKCPKNDFGRIRIIDMIKRKNAQVFHVTPGVASVLIREEAFEPLHMYISEVEPIQSEIGRILNDENKYTRLVQRAFDTNGGHLEELEAGREGHGGGDQGGVLRI